jgi:hypothetical protein
MKGKVPVQDAWASWVSFPPLPLLRYTETVGGRGGMAGRVLLGDPERGRGGYSGKSIPRAGIAPNSGKENPRAGVALEFGKLFWQIIPASIWPSLSGTTIWRVLSQAVSANIQWVFKDEIEAKKKKSKLCIIP